MKAMRFGGVRISCAALAVALFCFHFTPASAAVHVLQFTVPPGFANYLFYLDDPALNGKRSLRLTVTQRFGTAANDHPIGVYFDGNFNGPGKWSVFNEDFANIPPGAAFNVLVGSLKLVNASSANSVENITFFPIAMGKPPFNPPPVGKKAGFLFFSHTWQPFQRLHEGLYVPHHQSVGYSFGIPPLPMTDKWYISNEDVAPAAAAAYFVLDASTPPKGATVFGHSSTVSNIGVVANSQDETFISDPATNGKVNAVVFITPVGDQAYDKAVGVSYNLLANQWTIFNEDLTAFSPGKDFNVLVFPGVIP